jgi:hypothetical protein
VKQIQLLARTFFARMFESDLMPEGLPQVQLVLWGVLLAATPTTGYPLLIRRASLDTDRVILISLSMVAIGFVGLIIWDAVFPDRRDVRILGSLPVPTHRFVLARLAALGQVYVLFVTAICVPQSIFFGLLAAGVGDPLPRLYGIAAHLATVLCACTFVFCSLIAAQCLLLLVFGRRAAQAASMIFQVLFAVGLIQLVFFLGEFGRVLRQGGQSHDGLTALAALPPLWFFGLFEMLAGRANENGMALARIGVLATVASAALTLALYASSYAALSRRALDGPAPQGRGASRAWLARLLQRGPTRGFNSPLRTAIRQFTIRTLARSRTHRMMLAVYAGIALAIVMSSALSVAMRDSGAALWSPGLTMLSMPLIVQFFMLVAIRVIIAVPSEPKARWVFRACEPADRSAAVSAARDTMMVLVVAPTALLALAQGLIFWTVGAALSHAVFCWVIGRLFAELLVARTGKLPFACTYFPGTSGVFTLWPLYVLFFFFYTLGLAAVDRRLIARPFALGIFCLGTIVAARLLAWYRRRTLAELPGLRFEEEDPDAIFQGFQLSEALAAAPRSAAQR